MEINTRVKKSSYTQLILVKEIYMYNAGGWGGQRIMVLPEFNSVLVFTGGNYTSSVRTFKILEKYIMPAIN